MGTTPAPQLAADSGADVGTRCAAECGGPEAHRPRAGLAAGPGGRPARVPVRLRMLRTVGAGRAGARVPGDGLDAVAVHDHSYECELRPDGGLFVRLASGLRLRVWWWCVEAVEWAVAGVVAGPGDGPSTSAGGQA